MSYSPDLGEMNPPRKKACLCLHYSFLILSRYWRGSQDGYNMKAFQILEELVAIDPGRITKYGNNCLMDGDREARAINNKNAQNAFPKTKFQPARYLLEDHLVPTLWQSDDIGSSASRVHRIGLAVQELLKVSHCDQDTAMSLAQVANGDASNVNEMLPIPNRYLSDHQIERELSFGFRYQTLYKLQGNHIV